METKHTPEPWSVERCFNESGTRDMTAGHTSVEIQHNGFHIGTWVDNEHNGYDPNSRRIVACINACAGIPTEALENGVIGEMKEALVDLLGVADIKADDEDGHSYSCRWCGRKYADDECTPMFCESDDCPGHIARAVLSNMKG